MKVTIDIPDDLYRLVKAKSALRGQPVREVVMGLFQDRLLKTYAEHLLTPHQVAGAPDPAWFGMARKYAGRVRRHDMAAVRDSIARGRSKEGKTAAEPTKVRS